MRRRALALLVPLALAAGCGGTSTEDYVHEVNDLQEKHGERIADLSREVTEDSRVVDDRRVLDRQADEVTGFADGLYDVEVPDDAKAGRGRLAREADELARAIKTDVVSGIDLAMRRYAVALRSANASLSAGIGGAPVAVAGFSGGGSRGGGGGFARGGGGGSKSYGGGGGSKPSGGSKSGGSSKAPTASKPSTGSKSQPAPLPKLVPRVAPAAIGAGATARVRAPAGRNYASDRRVITGSPRYGNPYGRSYYGSFDSPFFYIWLGSVMDGEDRPLPPEADGAVSEAMLSYAGLVKAEAELVARKARP